MQPTKSGEDLIKVASATTHSSRLKQALGPIDIQAVRLTVSPAEEYFKHYMLLMEKETSLDKLGGMNWRLVGCLALSWVICCACLIKGVKSAGKVGSLKCSGD